MVILLVETNQGSMLKLDSKQLLPQCPHIPKSYMIFMEILLHYTMVTTAAEYERQDFFFFLQRDVIFGDNSF